MQTESQDAGTDILNCSHDLEKLAAYDDNTGLDPRQPRLLEIFKAIINRFV